LHPLRAAKEASQQPSSHPTASQHIRKKARIHEVVLPPDIDLKFTADVAKVDRLL
jgi:hypothetical protein